MVNITQEIDKHRIMGLKWVEIALILQKSISWLKTWRVKTNYVDPRSNLTDAELDNFVRKSVEGHPNRGENLLSAAISESGYNVTRKRIRESIFRVDPIGRQNRREKKIKRRIYHVAGPHHLWHLDTNHKMVRFNLSVAGGIAGFSRTCTFLSCNDNNLSVTMLSEFIVGVERYGIPSRIRTDKGGENIDVIRYMLRSRGLDRNTCIALKSTGSSDIGGMYGRKLLY